MTSSADKNSFLKSISQTIREHRLAREMSQEELASASGLHRTYLSDVERGLRNLSVFSLLAIAQSLGTTMSELIRDAEER